MSLIRLENVIKSFAGAAIVENPETAFIGTMPRAALKAAGADCIVNLDDIPDLLMKLCGA